MVRWRGVGSLSLEVGLAGSNAVLVARWAMMTDGVLLIGAVGMSDVCE